MRFLTHRSKYQGVGGLGLDRFDGYLISLTNGPDVADMPLLKRPSSLFHNQQIVGITDTEGTYVEDVDYITQGWNFPVAKAVSVSTINTSLQKVISLTSTTVVGIYTVGGKLYAVAGTINVAHVITWGSVKTVNDVNPTEGSDICRVSDTMYAISYIDDYGSTGYLCVRMGSVDGTTITQYPEKELNAATLKTGSGTAICLANTLTLCVGYVLNDGKGYLIASNFVAATGVVSTGGSAEEFDAGDDTKELSICSHTVGDVAVVYQAGGDTDDPITMCCATVAMDKTVSAGAEVNMMAVDAISTSIDCIAIGVDRVAFCWIDSTFLHISMATIAVKVPTKRTELELTDVAALSCQMANLDNRRVVVTYEADSITYDPGRIVTCSVSGTTWTNEEDDYFAYDASGVCVQSPSVCALTADKVLIMYLDDDNSNRNAALVGYWDKYIIDLRSNVVSQAMRLFITPAPGKKRKA